MNLKLTGYAILYTPVKGKPRYFYRFGDVGFWVERERAIEYARHSGMDAGDKVEVVPVTLVMEPRTRKAKS